MKIFFLLLSFFLLPLIFINAKIKLKAAACVCCKGLFFMKERIKINIV